ncbi:MAG: ATP-binding cassette domain-containing protein [Oscillospiraceae bacterium]
MTEVEVRHLSLQKGAFALRDINFTVSPGEIFVLLGETGSGKTLLLESIAGFYPCAAGSVFMDGVPLTGLPPEQHRIGFVYQDYGLFPHMTVFENIAYGLKMRHCPRWELQNTVEAIARTLSITSILDRSCHALSGGEKQRTALARTLVLNPDLLLLDEPFSALDPLTRDTLQGELLRIHETYGCTILLVTHSFEEARRFGSRVGIMINGTLAAVRPGAQLFEPYEQDAVNRFLGIGTCAAAPR